MNCRIYLNINSTKGLLLNSIKELFNITDLDLSYLKLDMADIYVAKNTDYNQKEAQIFPDVFLYFPFILEIDSTIPDEKDFVSIINKILLFLGKQNISAIAAYDNEDLLVESGGYNNVNIPWNN